MLRLVRVLHSSGPTHTRRVCALFVCTYKVCRIVNFIYVSHCASSIKTVNYSRNWAQWVSHILGRHTAAFIGQWQATATATSSTSHGDTSCSSADHAVSAADTSANYTQWTALLLMHVYPPFIMDLTGNIFLLVPYSSMLHRHIFRVVHCNAAMLCKDRV